MATTNRHDDNDGSDIFWPGYVDATTNLVLNLLFLLTIMTVAVFMFALELGRTTQAQPEKLPIEVTESVKSPTSGVAVDPVEENLALKREVKRLNQMLAQLTGRDTRVGGAIKAVDATSGQAKPFDGVDKAVTGDFELLVRFKDDAVTFTEAEHDRLLESLKQIADGARTEVRVEVPAGFTEARRMGFYRVLAVRNLLLELEVPGKRIEVSVIDGASTADAALVKVRAFNE